MHFIKDKKDLKKDLNEKGFELDEDSDFILHDKLTKEKKVKK